MSERELIIKHVQKHQTIDESKLKELALEFMNKNYFCRTKGTYISAVQIDAFLTTMDLDGNKVLD